MLKKIIMVITYYLSNQTIWLMKHMSKTFLRIIHKRISTWTLKREIVDDRDLRVMPNVYENQRAKIKIENDRNRNTLNYSSGSYFSVNLRIAK